MIEHMKAERRVRRMQEHLDHAEARIGFMVDLAHRMEDEELLEAAHTMRTAMRAALGPLHLKLQAWTEANRWKDARATDRADKAEDENRIRPDEQP